MVAANTDIYRTDFLKHGRMNRELYEAMGSFGRATFNSSNPTLQLEKLKKEADEAIDTPHDFQEWADCYIALSVGAYMQGIDYEDLCAHIRRKFEILKTRNWEIDEAGLYQHIKTE
jgi:hypothetical protein